MWKRVAIGAALLASSLLVVSQVGATVFWETESEVDPFTDMPKASAWLQSFEGDNGWLGVRCIDGQLELLVWYEAQLDHETQVISRVGKNKAVAGWWNSSTTGDSLFHARPHKLLRQLLVDPAHQFAVRVWTKEGLHFDSIFNLVRIDEAMNVIRETGCLPQVESETVE